MSAKGFLFLCVLFVTPNNSQYLATTKHKKIQTINKQTHHWTAKNKKQEQLCLAKNIYFEGRGETLSGQLAIGLVTINRVINHNFPNTICKVVYQQRYVKRKRKKIAQFSWTLDAHSNTPKKTKVWFNIIQLSKDMTAHNSLTNIADFTDGSTHYHATHINPNWHNLRFTKIIDNHKFYTM